MGATHLPTTEFDGTELDDQLEAQAETALGVPSRVSFFGVPFIVAASTAPPVNTTSNATTTITFAVFLMPGPFS